MIGWKKERKEKIRRRIENEGRKERRDRTVRNERKDNKRGE